MKNNVVPLETPLKHGGLLFQTSIHVENMLETLGPDITRSLFDQSLGKFGTFPDFPLNLNEQTSINVLTDLYEQAKIDNVEREWQENIFYLINNFEQRSPF